MNFKLAGKIDNICRELQLMIKLQQLTGHTLVPFIFVGGDNKN